MVLRARLEAVELCPNLDNGTVGETIEPIVARATADVRIAEGDSTFMPVGVIDIVGGDGECSCRIELACFFKSASFASGVELSQRSRMCRAVTVSGCSNSC